MRERLAIFGSTGSIGVNALNVAEEQKNFDIVSLVCNGSNNGKIDIMERQIRRYNPEHAAVINEDAAKELKGRLSGSKGIRTEIYSGIEDAIKICTLPWVDKVVNSTVGISGLLPTIEFIHSGKDIAIANKESFVTGGSLINRLAREKGMEIAPIWEAGRKNGKRALYPIDSEHSAIWQCLQGEKGNEIDKIILTASGGPFRNSSIEEMKNATVDEALNHPTWKMGGRITIDSATLMNKGFEVIEAAWLFGVRPEQITIQVHPQSIIHSMVQFKDGSIKAQMSPPDMKLPIQYALTYPERMPSKSIPRLDLAKSTMLNFEGEPDTEKFRCLGLAFEALKLGGTAPAVLNGADEKAVELFLDRKIKLLDIPEAIEKALASHKVVGNPNIKDILLADREARGFVAEYAREKYPGKLKSVSI
ncbi:MAG: 1-deoxy-D-xylulose-5-phosphate reductoisomerase [Candidatus Micrarchaeota archaeon]|nr:1-deoxy-D-xylulose-5-phosphate reductoisomerase [Candidatus Micrarchaeota archaeon]